MHLRNNDLKVGIYIILYPIGQMMIILILQEKLTDIKFQMILKDGTSI